MGSFSLAGKGRKRMTRENPLDRYNCGLIEFSGGDNALFERHLTFDQVVPVESATPREFEAAARSIRDVLSQRWLKTEQTHLRKNAKRVYYCPALLIVLVFTANLLN